MAKRLTDTNKYKKPFIRSLKGPYKILWDYLYHDCDHAGIWIVDFEVAQLYVGKDMPVNKEDALKYFNEGEQRIIEFDDGQRWFIPSFIEIQYGKLNEKNRVHNSVISILQTYNLLKKEEKENKGLKRPLEGTKNKDKDMILLKSIKGTEILPEYFDIFLRWLHYKRKKGKSYKDEDSVAAAYRKLVHLSKQDPAVAAQIIEDAMANNYEGFFALKEERKFGKIQPKIKTAHGKHYFLEEDGQYRSKEHELLIDE
jgi:hypothetical protein